MKECGYKENGKCNTCAECMSCPENTEEMTVEIALHCMKSALCESQCEECPMYGKVGTDHCDEDAHRLAIKALEKMAENQQAVMNFAVAVLAGVAECAKQEDAPIYKGDVEDDYFVRLSDVNEVINKHLN